MAFTASFSVQQFGVGTLVFTDNSEGVDASITERRIFLYKYDNTTLVPTGTTTDYIVWPIADTTITLTDILDKDYALNQDVVWVTDTPDPDSTYEYEILTDYTAYARVFAGQLLAQRLARNPAQTNENTFDMNEARLLTNIRQADNAILILQNLGLSQGALDRAYYMRINQQFYFL